MKYVLNNVSCLTYFDKVISKPVIKKCIQETDVYMYL